MDAGDLGTDLAEVLLEEEAITARIAELAAQVETDYEGRDLLLVGVLKGATIFMADFARALHRHMELDWMAVSSYGSGTKSSGVVRILKDLDRDVGGPEHPRRRGHPGLGPDPVVAAEEPDLARAGLGRGHHAAAQARGGEGRGAGQVHRLRHPEPLRRGLRPRLRREVPQPAGRGHPRPARLRRLSRPPPGRRAAASRCSRSIRGTDEPSTGGPPGHRSLVRWSMGWTNRPLGGLWGRRAWCVGPCHGRTVRGGRGSAGEHGGRSARSALSERGGGGPGSRSTVVAGGALRDPPPSRLQRQEGPDPGSGVQ